MLWCVLGVGADAKHVAVGVADVEFADAPWLVGRWVRDVEAFAEAALMDVVDVVDPDRHPHAFVGGLVAVGAERRVVGAFAAAALAVAAQEDLAAAGLDSTEARGVVAGVRFPLEPLVPAELREPLEACVDVADVENRDDPLDPRRATDRRVAGVLAVAAHARRQ
jgi:hypothetical protein